ncbi:hypothetical protein [uncultured Pseudodesulfovibrio sp.]|uniref:hypothetical protein n=1 Tax=uncultured Pseudodesulfovibrio sp. TaxID=2035858 RepID=UPI0029C629CD|nr:hypothetical protein [uncultured Pseudodesulfovibrio sp.]
MSQNDTTIDWVNLIGGGFAFQDAPFAAHTKDRERAEEYIELAREHGLTISDAVTHAKKYLSTNRGWPTDEAGQLRRVKEFLAGKLPQ